jgi:hypothetical protein
MDLTGKFLVVWLSAEAIETFLGVLEPRQETAMASWIVAGQLIGESGPGLWLRVTRVLMPDGTEMPLREEPIYFLRWELVTTARLYDTAPRSSPACVGRLCHCGPLRSER